MLVLGIGLKFIPVVGSVSYLAGIDIGDLPDGKNYIVDGAGTYILGGTDVLIVDGT
jgi:hypothetical protein